MFLDRLFDRFTEHGENDAIVWRGTGTTYRSLLDAIQHWAGVIEGKEIPLGTVVSLEADFSSTGVALLLALIERGCTVVPLTTSNEAQNLNCRKVAEVEVSIEVHGESSLRWTKTGVAATHPILRKLKEIKHPGLVYFSSGSTGEMKAAVHDVVPLVKKFEVPRHAWRTINFLLFDHLGGTNTLLYTLSNGGCVVAVADRSPESVCRAIEQFKVELLPTSPTFINLLLCSEAHAAHDLSSLKVVTYGTEIMPQTTLKKFRAQFPWVRLQQTYGLSELGVMRTKSKSSDSLWVKIGGEDFETRVVDGLLEIKSRSAMLGYLNAPDPFTEDGWFKTGDAVEVDGDYIRFLGRKQEIINVGGEKVYPAEVESTIQLMDGVEDVVVMAEPNAITGQIVKACVKISTDETMREFRKRMYRFCARRLPAFKIPQKVVISEKAFHGVRFKRIRKEPLTS
jgi:acyl-CoA synthetase (AMP-forming)/AMP-acid ligase II